MASIIQTDPTTPTPTGPQRYLVPHLAEAIRTGKEATGLSWRQLAKVVGRSRSHLNHISLGKRVPSRETAELLIDTLNLKGEIADELRAAAVATWWERDAGAVCEVVEDQPDMGGTNRRFGVPTSRAIQATSPGTKPPMSRTNHSDSPLQRPPRTPSEHEKLLSPAETPTA